MKAIQNTVCCIYFGSFENVSKINKYRAFYDTEIFIWRLYIKQFDRYSLFICSLIVVRCSCFPIAQFVIFVSIQDKYWETRVYTLGMFWQLEDPHDVTPAKTHWPFFWQTSGPPESPYVNRTQNRHVGDKSLTWADPKKFLNGIHCGKGLGVL